jgi:hypothetical protein
MAYTEGVMPSRIRRIVRRLARAGAGCLLGGSTLVPLGPTTTSQAVNQMNSMSMRPLPMVEPRPALPDSTVWVPPRVIFVPGEPTGVVVPPHWERRTPEGDFYVPPLTAPSPTTGALQSFPGGYRSPTDERLYAP